MKVAFFSPLPPARSGIADYSAALLAELERVAEVTVFAHAPERFDASAFDAALYQIGNNGFHGFCYEAALAHPGIVVLHEANLHHLIADITIKRGDWDAYEREVEFDGGAEALRYARRVRALEAGPDYEGVPMLKRLLSRSRAVVVHSGCVESTVRDAGFEGPVARIPHGAWIPHADGLLYRGRLGLAPGAPLIGVFGFLKPYKRIAQSLRAFRRLTRIRPDARMILVGEPHPELQLDALLSSLGLHEHVRVLGFTAMEDFTGFMAACDVVLNLRYPTVGENSGTLMRALGLGRAVIVSEVGSFCEYPDEICLKAPVDATEEDHLFEYLQLLVNRPDLRAQLGGRAREWVERECNWSSVAARYADFIEAVAQGREWKVAAAAAHASAPAVLEAVPASYIAGWVADSGAREYLETHRTRLTRTLEMTPPGTAADRILEMGAYMQITPALKTRLGYGEVRGCYYGPAGTTNHTEVVSSEGERFACDIDLFDAEKDRFPYEDGAFSTVLCCELLEHLPADPMHMMHEINRVLKPGGFLVLTTPNIASYRALAAILQGYHPGFFPAYIRPAQNGGETDARHNREYTPREILRLLLDAGFEVDRLETGPFHDEPHPELAYVQHMLETYCLPADLRGDGIYAVGRKTGAPRERYPAWLYS